MESRLEELSLEGEEDGGFVIDVDQEKEGDGDPELCLVGRFVADRTIRTNITKVRMASI